MEFLKSVWRLFKKIGFVIGDIISTVFLLVFYYTIFLLFATPFKFLSKPMDIANYESNWTPRNFGPNRIEDLSGE